MTMEAGLRFLGEEVSASELVTIRQTVELYGGLSRMELAATVCELLGWHRANGRVKKRECREWLEELEAEGFLVLPAKRKGRPPGSKTSVSSCGLWHFSAPCSPRGWGTSSGP